MTTLLLLAALAAGQSSSTNYAYESTLCGPSGKCTLTPSVCVGPGDGGCVAQMFPDGGSTFAGWVTDFDCNFGAQVSFTFADAGPVVICGAMWTFINYGQFYSQPQLISGAGLSLTPTDPSGWSGNSFTAPGLATSLSAIAPLLDFTTPIRVTEYAQYIDGGSNNNGILVGIWNGVGSTTSTVWYFEATAGFSSGFCATGWVSIADLNGSSAGSACVTSNNNTGLMELPDGIAGIDATFLTGVYPSDGGWGSPQSWSDVSVLKTSGNMINTSYLGSSLSGYQLVLATTANNGGAALNFTGTIGRVKVEHFRQ
jgi:hypothetical protein